MLTPATLESFQQEAEIMANVNHENIVRLFGISIDQPGHYCIVMELMPKCSLFDVIHNGKPFEWNIRYNIASDIAKGLSLLHKRGIIHRDLKSLNILLGDGMRAKLTDFGLAEVKTETRTLSSTVHGSSRKPTREQGAKPVGTLAWMAPELFSLRPKYAKESDVYSYGIILWELAARKIPYQGAADIEIREGVKDGCRETMPADCPRSFATLITRCWDQRATSRPTADKVIEGLDGIQREPQYRVTSM